MINFLIVFGIILVHTHDDELMYPALFEVLRVSSRKLIAYPAQSSQNCITRLNKMFCPDFGDIAKPSVNGVEVVFMRF